MMILQLIVVLLVIVPPYTDCKSIFPNWHNTNGMLSKQEDSFSVGGVFSDCSSKDDLKRVNITVNWDPKDPKKGDRVTGNVIADLYEEVTSGSITVSVKYGNIGVVDETLDLCDLITQVGIKCPLKNRFTFHFKTNPIPDYLPSGKYTANAIATDQNGKELACLHGDLILG